MTAIGAEIRGLPALGDIGPVPPAEGAALSDMFGDIIAGMGAALAGDALAEEGASPKIGEDAATPAPDANAAANVVRLLTLTVKQQAKALAGEPETDGESETDTSAEAETPTQECFCKIPPVEDRPIPLVQPVTDQPGMAPQPTAASPAATMPARPQVETPPLKTQAVRTMSAAPILDTDEAPKSVGKSPVALAVAELMQATRPLSMPQPRKPGNHPMPRNDDAEPANFGREVRTVVHNAILAMQAQTPAPPIDPAQPMETVMEPLGIEPQADTAEFAIERQLDISAKGEWLDSLAQDIARTAKEGGTLRFKLNPENLGSLRVEITPHANGSAVRLTADTETARAIIADAQPRLVAEARANGLRIAETHVDLGGQNPSGDPRRHNAVFEEAPIRTARFLPDREESDGKPTRSQSERYA